jgi:hypothetical protein
MLAVAGTFLVYLRQMHSQQRGVLSIQPDFLERKSQLVYCTDWHFQGWGSHLSKAPDAFSLGFLAHCLSTGRCGIILSSGELNVKHG